MKMAVVPDLEREPESLVVGRVEGVLGVDEGGEPAGPLGLGDDVQGEGRLAAGLGAEDLDDTAARNASYAERQVEGEGARGNRGHLLGLLVAHAHDRTLPELPLYLRDGGVYSLAPVQCILQSETVTLCAVFSIGIYRKGLYCRGCALPRARSRLFRRLQVAVLRVKSRVRTSPLSPSLPRSWPLTSTPTAPAFPVLMLTSRSASKVREKPGCAICSYLKLPSASMLNQDGVPSTLTS